MPYVYAQAKESPDHGLPMVRALFIEFPNDPGSWLVDDEYLFGSQVLVAPLLHADRTDRDVYLPPGNWIDYQTGKAYAGGWQHLAADKLPVVVLVRDGTALPHIQLAQSTAQMDWTRLELTVFAANSGTTTATGLVCLPGDNALHEVSLTRVGDSFKLSKDPLNGKVTWTIRTAANR